jgi:hypothetical protein
MSAMTPDGLSDLLAGVAAFGRSLDEHFDPARLLAEFSARTQHLVPHDYMLIALLEDDAQTYSVFAEYAVRGGLLADGRQCAAMTAAASARCGAQPVTRKRTSITPGFPVRTRPSVSMGLDRASPSVERAHSTGPR